MKNKKFFLSCLLLPALAFPSVLSDLAAQMKPGEWRTLTTGGVGVQDILEPPGATSGGSGHILEYTDEAHRNPATGKIWIMGCARASQGKGGYQCFSTCDEDAAWIEFDEATNGWKDMPCSQVSTHYHSYDNAAMDPATGTYYFREENGNVKKYSNGSWSRIPDLANSVYAIQVATPFEWFPEAGGLIFIDLYGSSSPLKRWRPGESQWTLISASTPVTADQYGTISEYSAPRKLVYIGGGTKSTFKLWTMDDKLQIRPAKDSPVPMGIRSDNAVHTVDPVSGNFLVMAPDQPTYEYNPAADAWTSFGAHPLGAAYDQMAVAAPIPEYGVIFTVKYDFSGSKVQIYRHSAGTAAERRRLVAGGTPAISVSPNPVRGQAVIRIADLDTRASGLTIYDAQGKRVAKIPAGEGGEYRWRPKVLPSGIYVIQAGALREKIALVQ